MAQEKHRCEGRIIDYRGSNWACGSNAKVEREGTWYCLIHDPVRREEKRLKREKAREEIHRLFSKGVAIRGRRRELEETLCSALTTEDLEEAVRMGEDLARLRRGYQAG